MKILQNFLKTISIKNIQIVKSLFIELKMFIRHVQNECKNVYLKKLKLKKDNRVYL